SVCFSKSVSLLFSLLPSLSLSSSFTPSLSLSLPPSLFLSLSPSLALPPSLSLFNSIQFHLYSTKTMKLSQGALQSPGPEPPESKHNDVRGKEQLEPNLGS